MIERKETFKTLKVLVAEGNHAEREALARALSSLGHDVEAVADGQEALNQLRDGSFDILFLDRKFAGLDGPGVLQEILSLGLDTVPIITAPRLAADEAIAALRKGAYDYTVGPLHLQWLEIIIHRALQRQRAEKLREKSVDDLIMTGRFYQDILENIRSGILVTDREDKVIFFNRAMENISGVKRTTVLGINFFKRFSSTLKRVPELARYYEQAKTSLEIFCYESLFIIHKDGSKSIQSGVMYPLKNEGGEFDGMVVTVEDVTERKKAEEALKEALARFESAIEQTPSVAIQGYDKDGRIMHWNRASEVLYGLEMEEVMGKKIQDLFLSGEEVGEFERDIEAIWRTGKPSEAREWRVVTQSGEMRWVYSTMFPIFSHNRVAEIFCMDVDVTDRKKAEENLQKSEKRFQDIAVHSAVWIWEIDTEGRYTYSSPVVEQVLGYTPDEVIGKQYYDFFHPDHRERLKADAEEIIKREKPFKNFINPNVHKEGHTVILETSGAPIIDEDGTFLGYRGADRDITERTRAEEALALSKQWYQTIFDSATDAIFILDPQAGRILAVNEKGCEMFGYTKEEALELSLAQISMGTYPYTEEEVRKWIQRAYSGGPQTSEWMCRHKDGHVFPVEANLKRALILGKDRLMAIVRDITERKKLEKELIHAEKMAGVGQLAAGIAHEFNNFLAMISGYAQLAKAGTLEDKERAIDVADKVSERAKVVVKNLISFAREDKPEKVPTDIAEVVEEALAPLATLFKRQGITVKRNYSPVPVIHCDPGQIRQVLFNIILNAIQAMPEGGDLAIGLHPEDDDVVITVADSGPGIPPEILENIFDPFVTTKGAIAGGEISGSGLGLSVSYGLVKEHGGEIVAKNNAGGGATFTIRLPALREKPTGYAPGTPPPQGGEDAPFNTQARILVIDDEEIILELLTEILQKRGKRVTAVRDPRLALSLLKHERYDIIFLDLVMPGYPGGLGLFREIKRNAPHSRIVLLTGKKIDEEIKAALEEGACDFISKPFAVEELNVVVEAALRRRPF